MRKVIPKSQTKDKNQGPIKKPSDYERRLQVGCKKSNVNLVQADLIKLLSLDPDGTQVYESKKD